MEGPLPFLVGPLYATQQGGWCEVKQASSRVRDEKTKRNCCTNRLDCNFDPFSHTHVSNSHPFAPPKVIGGETGPSSFTHASRLLFERQGYIISVARHRPLGTGDNPVEEFLPRDTGRQVYTMRYLSCCKL